METPEKEHAPRPLVWCLVVALCVSAFMALVPLRSPETWWYLTIGRLVDTYQAVPDQNHLLYSVPVDKPSFILEWLSSKLMHAMNRAMGIELVVTARNLAMAAAAALAAAAAIARGRASASPTPAPKSAPLLALGALFGAGVACWGITTTPIMFGALLFAMTILIGEIASGSERKWALPVAWLLFPGIAALWANLDPSAFLPAMLASWFASRTSEPSPLTTMQQRAGWAFSALASGLALLANPRGAQIYEHLWTIHTLYPGIPDASGWAHIIPMANIPGAILTAGVVLCVSAYALTRTRPTPGDVICFVCLLALAISRQRGMLWFGLVMPLLMAPALVRMPGLEKLPGVPSARWKRALLATSLIIAMIPLQPMVVTHAAIATTMSPYDVRQTAPHRGVLERDVPLEIGAFLAQTSAPPKIWASPEYEPYLIYRLTRERPAPLVFSDPRHELRGEKVRELRSLVETTPDLWRGLFRGWDVSAAVLSKQESQSKLLDWLIAHPNWVIAHQDDHAVYLIEVRIVD